MFLSLSAHHRHNQLYAARHLVCVAMPFIIFHCLPPPPLLTQTSPRLASPCSSTRTRLLAQYPRPFSSPLLSYQHFLLLLSAGGQEDALLSSGTDMSATQHRGLTPSSPLARTESLQWRIQSKSHDGNLGKTRDVRHSVCCKKPTYFLQHSVIQCVLLVAQLCESE